MSIFKEKDDLFASMFQGDSDDSDSNDKRSGCKSSSQIESAKLDDDDDDDENGDHSKMKKQKLSITPDIGQVSDLKLDSTNSTLDESKVDGQTGRIDAAKCQNELVTIDDDETVIYSNNVIEILSSDDEEPTTSHDKFNSTLESEPTPIRDLSQREINLKLTIGGKYYQYESTYQQTFAKTFEPIINDLKRQNKCLILTVEDKHISLQDSPQSVNLHAGSIIKGFDVAEKNEDPVAQPRSSNEVLLKIQDGNRKHTRQYLIQKTEAMSKLKELYGKDIGIEDIGQIRLCFDGDIVDDDQTPEELDMEDDCVVDALICSGKD